MAKNNIVVKKLEKLGDIAVEVFHLIGLFVIGATIVWAAVHEYLVIMKAGHANLHDILMLFIYLELGAMVGIYFKTHKLPVRFLIYIAITALTRFLTIDVKSMDNYTILTVSGSILILTICVFILKICSKRFGSGEDSTA